LSVVDAAASHHIAASAASSVASTTQSVEEDKPFDCTLSFEVRSQFGRLRLRSQRLLGKTRLSVRGKMNNLRLSLVVAARQRYTAATTITTTSPRPIDSVAEV